MTDHNEAMRLADRISPETDWYEFDQATWCNQAAALIRKQAEQIAELEAAQAGIFQAITDPENQPSQYGTVTLDYLSDKLKEWERRYAKRDEQADKAAAERDTLRAEVERLRVDAERWGKFIGLSYQVRAEWAANLSLVPVLTSWVDSLPANDTARKATQ